MGHNPKSPVTVIHATAAGMDLFFQRTFSDPTHFRTLLTGDTIDFIWQAEKGFFRNIPMIDHAGLLRPSELIRLRQFARGLMDEGDENEAFGAALVTFSFMPELLTHPQLPRGFSRQGMVRPPATTGEYGQRFRELRGEVMKIVAGQTDPNDIRRDTLNRSLLRTYGFFQAGNAIPDKMPPSAIELRQNQDYLLRDIEVNL